jgi:hypothetical protein
MATATWTIDDYKALCKNIAQGVLIVKYADKEVQYRSLADMVQLQQLIAQSLGLSSGKSKVHLAQQAKGLRW